MNLQQAVLEGVRRHQPAIFSDVYSTVMTLLGPYSHENVSEQITLLEREKKIRKLRLGGTPHYVIAGQPSVERGSVKRRTLHSRKNPKPRRGKVLVHHGDDWMADADEWQPSVYGPVHGREVYMGKRQIHGREHNVWRAYGGRARDPMSGGEHDLHIAQPVRRR